MDPGLASTKLKGGNGGIIKEKINATVALNIDINRALAMYATSADKSWLKLIRNRLDEISGGQFAKNMKPGDIIFLHMKCMFTRPSEVEIQDVEDFIAVAKEEWGNGSPIPTYFKASSVFRMVKGMQHGALRDVHVPALFWRPIIMAFCSYCEYPQAEDEESLKALVESTYATVKASYTTEPDRSVMVGFNTSGAEYLAILNSVADSLRMTIDAATEWMRAERDKFPGGVDAEGTKDLNNLLREISSEIDSCAVYNTLSNVAHAINQRYQAGCTEFLDLLKVQLDLVERTRDLLVQLHQEGEDDEDDEGNDEDDMGDESTDI
ncbi:hypothetical protein NM208_g5855 [Fusarium decemcellulare]|uniref:Uncharacterized protein n=1 Tax=Fusarium decemcellulare TaxID=57161 RepID=A0ACC1SFG5_9HYPO|nr:hypothetical protein NM208_g5855 [Fusarium decemcellulare]